MLLKEFSLINPKIESGQVFQALETVISPQLIEQALKQTKAIEKRKRQLPSSLVVCLVIAMSLWSSDSMSSVLQNLVNGLNRGWTKLGQYWKTPSSSSISEALAEVRLSGNEQTIYSISLSKSDGANPGSFLGRIQSHGSRWDSVGCPG